MFPIYPYINVNDLNLDYLLKSIKEIQTQVEYFVSLNAIKYADPIQWDITRQYEKNTIVIDPQTGTAYISVAPVPIGAQLTRPEYWTVVFDLGSFVVRASKNFAINYEADTTTTATFNTPQGGWLVWGDVLYIANVPITAGDSYVEGGNISHFTMEEIIGHLSDLSTTDKSSIVNAINELYTALNNAVNALSLIIGDLNDLTTTDKTSIVNAINELVTNIGNVITSIGDLNDLTTSDKTSVVNAINSLVTDLGDLSNDLTTLDNKVGDLNDLITTDKTSIVNAINEVKGDFNAEDLKVGDLADLTTTDKSSIVNAINDIQSIVPPAVTLEYVTPDDFGGVGDNTTDDTQAINDAITECMSTGKTLYFPNRTYKTTSTINITSPNFDVIMDGFIHYTGTGDALSITGMHYHTIKVNLLGDYPNTTNDSGLKLDNSTNNSIYINKVSNFNTGITLAHTSSVAYNTFYLGSILNIHIGIHMDVSISTAWTNENLFIGGRFTNFSSAGITAGLIAVKTTANSSSHSPNNNVFIKPCMENSGALDIGFDLTNCKGWTILNARFESALNPVKLTNCYAVKITGYDLNGTVTDDRSFDNSVKRIDYFNVEQLIPIFETESINKCHYNSSYGEYPEYCYNLDQSKGYVESPVVNNNYIKVGTSVCIKLNVSSLKGKALAWVFTGQSGEEYRTSCRLIDDNNAIITTIPTNNNGFSLGTGDDGQPMFFDSGTSPIWYFTKIIVPNNCKEIIIRGYINDSPRKMRTIKIFAEKEFNCVPIKVYQKGIPTAPTDSTVKGEYVLNNGTGSEKGWYYNGSSWVADYVYDPNA